MALCKLSILFQTKPTATMSQTSSMPVKHRTTEHGFVANMLNEYTELANQFFHGREPHKKTGFSISLPGIIPVSAAQMNTPLKILAIQFKYFGDAVLLTPALRALREQFQQSELHLLVPEEIAPLLEHSPRLNRVWPMPRRRGRSSLSQTLPIIRALRRERFDRSVDFASNDRGAIASFLIGAKDRLGWDEPGGFLGRKFCYTRRVPPKAEIYNEYARMVHLLSGWNVSPPR